MSLYDHDADPDPDLGERLRALPVPEHGDGFWEALDGELEARRTRPRVTVDDDARPTTAAGALGPEVLTPSGRAQRRAATWRPASAEAPPSRPGLGRRGRAVLAAVAVAAAVTAASAVAVATWSDDDSDRPVAPAAPGRSRPPAG